MRAGAFEIPEPQSQQMSKRKLRDSVPVPKRKGKKKVKRKKKKKKAAEADQKEEVEGKIDPEVHKEPVTPYENPEEEGSRELPQTSRPPRKSHRP